MLNFVTTAVGEGQPLVAVQKTLDPPWFALIKFSQAGLRAFLACFNYGLIEIRRFALKTSITLDLNCWDAFLCSV